MAAGVSRAEVASFVNPARVPQMADAEAVVAGLVADGTSERVAMIGLVLNARGFERAADDRRRRGQPRGDGQRHVQPAQPGHDHRGGSARRVEEVAPLARAAGLVATVTLSATFGCPYEGEVPLARVVGLAERLAATGVDELAIADTIGVAVPGRRTRARRPRSRAVTGDDPRCARTSTTPATPATPTRWRRTSRASRVLDASLGGIGGCPFAPSATGNIATEDLVYLLERSGITTGLDLDALVAASDWLGDQLGRPTPALVSKAGGFPTGAPAA